METLKYKVIKTDTQYYQYCDRLEELVGAKRKSRVLQDEIELLKSLMKDHKMKAVQLARMLNVSEGLISDILHYKKGLSKDTIRILSDKFKLNQEAFNRPYHLYDAKQTMQGHSRRRKVLKKLKAV